MRSMAIAALVTAGAFFFLGTAWAGDCTAKGIPLYGRVKVVEHFADLDVKVVESFPDLYVKLVDAFADRCGEWQMVESFPDFTIRFVDAFPDLEIKYVNVFPGEP